MDVEVERRPNLAPVVHLTARPEDSLTAVRDAFELARNAGVDAPVWLHGATAEREEILRDAGYSSDRTMLQLLVPLPLPAADPDTTIATRSFTEADIDAVVTVNNRAFDWHPEQAGKDAAWLLDAMAEDWFDADGFRLYEIDGRLAGFCWTKIHQQPDSIGEIYVIALDPDFTGRGLGVPVSRAGLDWLADQNLDAAMLFVESDNGAAIATYERLGFSVHRTDTLWRLVSP